MDVPALTAPARDLAPIADAPPLSQLMVWIWREREDIRSVFGLDDRDGRVACLRWFLDVAVREYGLPEAMVPTACEAWLAAPHDASGAGAPVTRFMAQAHQDRPDLQAQFCLDVPRDCERYSFWFCMTGEQEYRQVRSARSTRERLADWGARIDLAGIDGDPLGAPVPNLLVLLWRLRPDLQGAFDLDSPLGRGRYLVWFQSAGQAEFPGVPAMVRTAAQVDDWLAAPAGVHGLGERDSTITNRAVLNWQTSPKTARWGNLRWPWGRAALRAWTRWTAFRAKAPPPDPNSGPAGTEPVAQRAMPPYHTENEASLSEPPAYFHSPWFMPAGAARPPRHATGVTLLGFLDGALGLGEHARSAAASLAAAGCPYGVISFAAGMRSARIPEPPEHPKAISNDFPVTLFNYAAFQSHILLGAFGGGFFQDRYSIGYWPWELPRFPAEWRDCVGLYDEIWAPSTFVAEAIRPAVSIPVQVMPLSVGPLRPDALTRAELGLPEAPFLFVFSFDSFSFIQRKNPYACIEAFRRAFPDPDSRDVGLVIKSMNIDPANPHGKALSRLAAEDPRVHLVDRVLGRGEYLALIAACDAYVSLHRAEGFGYGPAEAMALGKPVIVTDYGGVCDYVSADTACLVPYRLIPVGAEEYVYSEGQFWADPDVGAAAAYMRDLVAEPQASRALGDCAQSWVERLLSPETVGALFRKRLETLGAVN